MVSSEFVWCPPNCELHLPGIGMPRIRLPKGQVAVESLKLLAAVVSRQAYGKCRVVWFPPTVKEAMLQAELACRYLRQVIDSL
jgi:hypothetical protein